MNNEKSNTLKHATRDIYIYLYYLVIIWSHYLKQIEKKIIFNALDNSIKNKKEIFAKNKNISFILLEKN